MDNRSRQFTPFERFLRRLYELSLRTLPNDISRRWAADMRTMFGERLRDATDYGGAPATVAVGARELGSIAFAALQSRFGQATGRVHRAHDAQDGSDVWRTDPVPALFIKEDRRPLKLATVGALACHFALFLVVFPGTATPGLIREKPQEVWVLQDLNWEPLPPPEARAPDARRHDLPPLPFPDPTPWDPELLLDDSVDSNVVYRFDARQPVSADFEVGLPVAPPTPPQQRVRGGADVELPRPLERAQPEYTELAIRARLQCTVVLEAVIGKAGEVMDVKILRGCRLGLDESALNAVYQWRYTPTTVNGRPVEVIVNVTVHFELH
jgi:TonB family protein